MKTRISIPLLLSVIALFSVSLNSAIANEQPFILRLQTENYPPFNMSIEDKNFSREIGIDGIAADIVRELMKRSEVDYTMTLRFPWKRIYELTLRKPDYGIFSTTFTEERKPLFQWVGPLVSNNWVIFVRSDSDIEINTLDDLKKYKVGGYKGDAIAQFLKANDIPVIESFKDNANPVKLSKGQIDAWAAGEITGRYIADLEGVSGMKTAFQMKSTEMYIALNKAVPKPIVNKLQMTLDKMRDEGVVQELTQRYQ